MTTTTNDEDDDHRRRRRMMTMDKDSGPRGLRTTRTADDKNEDVGWRQWMISTADDIRRRRWIRTADNEDGGLRGQRMTRRRRMTTMDDLDGGRWGRQQMTTTYKDSRWRGRLRWMVTADDAKQPLSHINFKYYSHINVLNFHVWYKSYNCTLIFT